MDFFLLGILCQGKNSASLGMFYLVGNTNFLEWFSNYFCRFLQLLEINMVEKKIIFFCKRVKT